MSRHMEPIMTTNAQRWGNALFTRSSQINAHVAKIEANCARYEAVLKQTGVPWDVIAVIHPMHGR